MVLIIDSLENMITEDQRQNLAHLAQNHVVKLVNLKIIPLSLQLSRITGDRYSIIDYRNESGEGLSAEAGNIIVHLPTGLRFQMPD